MAEETSISSTIRIDPNTLQPQQITSRDEAIIPSFESVGIFNTNSSKVELFIYDLNNNLIISDYDFNKYTLANVPLPESGIASSLELNPSLDVENYGYNTGKVNIIYNFIDYQLSSSPSLLYYISDISSDRTELRLKTNIYENDQIEDYFNNFKENILDSSVSDEFYLNFGENQYIIGVNAQLDTTTNETSVLIKLYEPLPPQYNIKDEIYVVTKVAESVGYQVSFEDTIQFLDDLKYLRGPNTNLNIKKQVNNSTEYQNYNSLTTTPISSSFYRLKQISNQKGININVDYTEFNNFIYFSSAEQRLQNFNYKLELIELYQSKSNAIEAYSSTPSSQISSSAGVYKTKIKNVIKNFDGYEYYLYYNSESKAWPKRNSTEPYNLYSVSSSNAKNWLGSSNEGSAYYGGRLYTASAYDNTNQNNLVYTIPEFIREDSDNSQYDLFINMMGQHFDNLWLYTKNITNKLDRDNRLTSGVSKDLVADVLKSLGTKIYGGGFAVEDIYTAFLGYNEAGSLLPPTGSELITNYITASADPFPLKDAQQELYKRIYNNLPYLLKKKGTIEGIRNLITIYGIPDTILRISEFGGKDKQNENDYDYYYNRYSYALKTRNSASVLIPWKPLKNTLASYVDLGYWNQYYTQDSSSLGADTSEGFYFPNSIQFRFKTEGIPVNTRYSQSIFVVKNPTLEPTAASQSFHFGVFLTYTGSADSSGSYSGSITNPYNKYGNLELILSGSTEYISSSINLPFYDGGWWSGMLTRNLPSGSTTASYSLFAGNNIYNGPDGDKVGFYSTCSLNSTNLDLWRTYTTTSIDDGLWLGGHISGSKTGTRNLQSPNMIFSGSFQELRYSSYILGENIFKDFIMNPESIEGATLQGSGSSFEVINFRAPLGNELFELTSSNSSYHTHSLKSMHPAVTASSPSQIIPSFIYGSSGSFTSSSMYRVIWQDSNLTGSYADKHTETYYLDQPVVGLKNRITDKIKLRNNTAKGKVLSNQISIQQNPSISESYIRDVNQLEVAFSPQNEINDDIIQTYGYFNIGEFIGDPRFISSSDRTYPNLDVLQREYFKKYYKQYNIFDYVRLIKYFDNSLFKMIKDYVPARTSLSTGVVIKQHILERNRQRPAQLNYITPEYTQSISVGTFSGSAGGSINKYNTTTFNQAWTQSIQGISGSVTKIHSGQEEFYNGEYSGSYILITTQSLNIENTYKSTGTGVFKSPSGSVPLPFNKSDYNVLINNVTESVKDNLVQVINYNQNALFPYNYDLITGSNALKAQIPKSFFTQKANINPRYDGVELKSTDYNNYTVGDISYGTTAVIDKHPKYFAHFKKSHQTLEIFGEQLFTLDYLIPADADIPSNISNLGQIPGILQVKGDESNQYITANNFEKGRKCSIDFIEDKGFISEGDPSGSINWGALENKKHTIVQGGNNYIGLAGNQNNYVNIKGQEDWNISFEYSGSTFNPMMFQSANGRSLLITGSNKINILGDLGYFAFVLNQNRLLSASGEPIDSTSYLKWNPPGHIATSNGGVTSRGSKGYVDSNIIFDLKKGDEIRMLNSDQNNIIFTITEDPVIEGDRYVDPWIFSINRSFTCSVVPNPEDYSLPTTSSFFIRRRVEQDNKVSLRTPHISGSLGNTTPSSTGFLIPDDFTQDQKDKTANIITILKGNNLV